MNDQHMNKGKQGSLCCWYRREKILTSKRCGACHTLKRQDAEHFGGLREQALERDGHSCWVCPEMR